jgi:primosomal protein N' (replication factor Y)
MLHRVDVVVPTPAHSSAAAPLSYSSEQALAPGTLVRVPLGKREVLGIVWPRDADPDCGIAAKPVSAVLAGIAPLSEKWRELVAFSSDYYQRSLGEVALAALPPQLRDLDATQWQRRMKRGVEKKAPPNVEAGPPLTDDQRHALARLSESERPSLLFGVTGSGKTEVYLRAVQRVLESEPDAQALVLVPEINLTPQLQARFAERFGESAIAAMHSGMTPAQRLRNWLAAHGGAARVVLGTRMAVFASMPSLRLVVVDEEHDASYKQQEGARYSARDLAVMRGKLEGAQVILGSATPSLESWQAANKGRYERLEMANRVGEATLPQVRIVDMQKQPKGAVLSPPLVDAIQQRVRGAEQTLLLLNRRGYAPVLACTACDWKSDCPNCSAYRVFHKIDRTLRCHHCGFTDRVPRACPSCGNVDISPIGRGTEKLEEHVGELLAGVTRANGEPVRIARMDADSTRGKGVLEAQLARMHSGDVDVLVGTQMVTKGHDFRRITLVAAINVDSALFSGDFRAPERLFALLMQAAGRAGRDAHAAGTSEMWVQTWNPQHPLFSALRTHDYPAFAKRQLAEREQAGMPPFGFQALVRADARTQEAAQAFLRAATERAKEMPELAQVSLYSPVPATMQRIANVERAQMLVESASRPALQRFLATWRAELHGIREKGLIRWAIDVDPLAI